jgi:hypothetical protein
MGYKIAGQHGWPDRLCKDFPSGIRIPDRAHRCAACHT